jgi:hypothetical protein
MFNGLINFTLGLLAILSDSFFAISPMEETLKILDGSAKIDRAPRCLYGPWINIFGLVLFSSFAFGTICKLVHMEGYSKLECTVIGTQKDIDGR